MSKNKEVVYTVKDDPNKLYYHCPGCKCDHFIIFQGPNKWTWNGDKVNPTFAPSIKVSYNYGPQKIQNVCHFFVRNGNIEYLGDCTHDHKNTIIKMLPND